MSNESAYLEHIDHPYLMRTFLGIFGDTDIFIVKNELNLLRLLTLLVILTDPDLVGGWDLERASISYIVHRSNEYDIDILTDISRS